ncbi:MAG TPA: hypothetical protein VK661_09615, partial [Planctomycetota bacterium]|nr:hypothetical protein [Planctomycetota bacterium]
MVNSESGIWNFESGIWNEEADSRHPSAVIRHPLGPGSRWGQLRSSLIGVPLSTNFSGRPSGEITCF